MHREFKKLLENATGESEFVIAINLDIRGFSLFSMAVESSEAAVFLKRVYKKLIEEYFADASFFKPTGDGLLIIIPYTAENLKDVLNQTIGTCLKVLVDFGSLCAGDSMINFEVPRKVGIGLSRGAASRIVSRGKTLDYSGKVLNLASRLMDLARPSGIVFDASFGIELLPQDKIALFAKDSVFIKGIAEREPIDIYFTKDSTTVSPINKQPIEKVKWDKKEDTKTLREIKQLGPSFLYSLLAEPIDPAQIKIRIAHPAVLNGRQQKGFKTYFDFPNFQYFLEAGEPKIRVAFDALAGRLEKNDVKVGWKVTLTISYPQK